jgi:hypothetical protein
MTFENKTISEVKPSDTRAGLIYLQKKESIDDNNDTSSSSRQFYNQTRKKATTTKSLSPKQPQPITQTLRGLTNVTRTLYDPNAPTPKTPPMSVIQPITVVKIVPTISHQPSSVNTTSNNPAQIQEFQQQ